MDLTLRMDRLATDPRKPISSTYGAGLKEVFAIPRGPLPRELEELLDRIQKAEDETH